MPSTAPTVVAITSYSEEGRTVRAWIEQVLEEHGFEVIDLDNVPVGGTIWARSVQDAITKADFVVADLTNLNPNVLYEIGYAHAWGKRVILLVHSGTRHVPTDLSAYQYIIYEDEQELKHRLFKELEMMYAGGLS